MLRHATEIGSFHTYASAWERAPSTFLLVALGCAACALVAPAQAQASLARNGSPVEPSAERLIHYEPDRVGAPHGELASLDATTGPYDDPAQKLDLKRVAQSVRDRVYHHPAGEDGTLWARGEAYKGRFGTEGASYVPFLGSSAPRNFPVDFRLAEVSVGGAPLAFETAVPAQRTGDTIRYERGALVELYELELGSIEQRFVFDKLPLRGELVVRIAIETELEARELPERLEFANELGAVRYGRATAIDASGASVSAPTTLTTAGIEIRVPAEFVARARLPIVIDPVISTFTVDTGPLTEFYPDCAFDATTLRWMEVHEEVFSVYDHDVVWRMMHVLGAGQTLTWGYVDTALSANWTQPACANNNATDRFFVVAVVAPFGSPTRILGRTIGASNGALGPEVDVGAGGSLIYNFDPDVGGDPYPSLPGYFLVAWRGTVEDPPAYVLYYRLVDPNGSVAGPIQWLGTQVNYESSRPSVSKSNDGEAWNVVWHQYGPPYPILGARIGWSGSVVASPFVITSDQQLEYGTTPSASSCLDGTQRWIVAYLNNAGETGGGYNIGLKLIDGSSVIDAADLTQMEDLYGLQNLSETQLEPDVDTDGRSFAVTYVQQDGSGDTYQVRVSTVGVVGSQLHLSESQVLPGGVGSHRPSIASTEGAGLAWRLQLVVYDTDNTSASGDIGNILGAMYDNALFTSFCHPTYDGVPACPCGNAPGTYGRGCNNSANAGGAQLFAGGISSIGSDSMTLHSYYMPATAMTIFNQGNAVLANGVVFGQGLRCVGGSIKRLYIKTAAGGVADAPVPGDPNIHTRSAALGDPILAGQTRGYYVYYRDPVVLGGCPSGSTFNTSQSIQASWIP